MLKLMDQKILTILCLKNVYLIFKPVCSSGENLSMSYVKDLGHMHISWFDFYLFTNSENIKTCLCLSSSLPWPMQMFTPFSLAYSCIDENLLTK